MKKHCFLYILIKVFSLSILCLLAFSCRDMISDMEELSPETNEIKSLSMVEVTKGSTTYRLNQYETTYLLWYDVFEWGKEHGFSFIQKAEAGLTHNSEEPGSTAFFPVTKIHPADLITWCNAYSAKKGLAFVYFSDSEKTKPVMHAQDIADSTQQTDDYGVPLTDMNGKILVTYNFSVKAVYSKTEAKGYRLPSKSEWQYAAQGGKNYGITNYAGSNDLSEVASLGKIRIPGSYKPNELGLFDMSGNVAEITLDSSGSSNTWGAYGGHYANTQNNFFYVRGNIESLYHIVSSYPNMFGFRLCQTVTE